MNGYNRHQTYNIEPRGGKLSEPLEVVIGKLLREKGLKLAVAESCTGGLVGHRITNIAGSSDYYLGSVTAYAYEAKERLLGVQHETLQKYGAVSEETVREMADGIRKTLDTDLGLSVSGIAGPGGGMPNKPVGLVWIGMSTPDGTVAFKHLWHGDRIQNKEQSAEAVLQHLADYLTKGLDACRQGN
jgi:PncC family amidohydrolase